MSQSIRETFNQNSFACGLVHNHFFESQQIQQKATPAPTSIPSRIITYDNNNNSPPTSFQPYFVTPNIMSSPKHIRLSISTPPSSPKVLKQTGLPFTVEITPFAPTYDGEENPSILQNPKELMRCQRCNGYVNPFTSFVENGKYIKCNLCSYLSRIDDIGIATTQLPNIENELKSKPEFQHGTIDYILTGSDPSYIPENLTTKRFIFVIDVSTTSLQNIFPSITALLPTIFSTFPYHQLEVGFLTFHSSLQFWVLGETIKLFEVNDLTTPIIPVPPSQFFVSFSKALEKMKDLFTAISTHITSNPIRDDCIPAVINAASDLLSFTSNGKILLFTTSFPPLKPNPSSFHQQDTTSPSIDYELLKSNSISIDFFCFTQLSQTIHFPTSALTDGKFSCFFSFTQKDQSQLRSSINSSLDISTQTDITLRLRVSCGLTVKQYFPEKHNVVDMCDTIKLTELSKDSSIICEIQHDSTSNLTEPIYLQCATLYTDVLGRRHLKIFNSIHSVQSNPSSIFSRADLDVVFASLFRMIPTRILFDTVCSIFAKYRSLSKTHTNSSNLVLPDSLRLLPLLIFSVTKNPKTLSVNYPFSSRKLLLNYYPYVFRVTEHCLGLVDEEDILNDRFKVRLTKDQMNLEDIFVFNDGNGFVLLIGSKINEGIMCGLFGTVVDLQHDNIIELAWKNVLSNHLNQITMLLTQCAQLLNQECYVDVSILNYDNQKYFIEDVTTFGCGYFEWLVQLHKQIKLKL
ncbi:Uncharacterized protein QTN25_000542 [Entamoeba marina]